MQDEGDEGALGVRTRAGVDAEDRDLVTEHEGVTHLQCTPSLARLLCADPASRAALSRLRSRMRADVDDPTPLVAA